MDSTNRRADYRVEVPGGFVRELAVWFCPEKDYLRLAAAELGRPHLTLGTLGSGRMTLSDLSIRGMGMHAILPREETDRFLAAKACFTYLKLWDPTTQDPFGVLSVFTYNRLLRVAAQDEGLFLGVRFERFAVGSRLDKTLEFLDAKSVGVMALARWCDNLARGVQIPQSRHGGGLDMDNLLAEVEHALADPGFSGKERT